MTETNILKARALDIYPRLAEVHPLHGPCWGPAGPPPLDQANKDLLLGLQQTLRNQRMRGGMHEVRQWINQSELCGCVATNSRSVGLFMSRDRLEQGGQTTGDSFAPFVSKYSTVMELRSEDYLFDEWMWARVMGSCFLVDDDRVMTSAHLLGGTVDQLMGATDFVVVFDFQAEDDGFPPSAMSKQESVFDVLSVEIDQFDGTPGLDWAILKLARPASRLGVRKPLRVANQPFDVSRGAYTLGHPMACQLRYIRTPNIWPSAIANCYEAHLDAYNGISGSPVFDPTSHQVIGLMSRSCPSGEGQIKAQQGNFLSPLCLNGDSSCGALIVSSDQFVASI